MAFKSAVVIGWGSLVSGREKVAMSNLTESLKHLKQLAADGKCAEPLVLGRLNGTGMVVILTESTHASHVLLEETFIERALVTAQYTALDLTVEVVTTGEAFMANNATFGAIGEELGYM